jgi:hypothetical protein
LIEAGARKIERAEGKKKKQKLFYRRKHSRKLAVPLFPRLLRKISEARRAKNRERRRTLLVR